MLDERNAAILRALRKGATLSEAAQPHGLTRERVRQIALRAGVISQHKRNEAFEPSPREKAVILDRWRRGMPIAHIAESIRRPERTVAGWLVRHGHHVRDHDDQEWTTSEIAFLKEHYKRPGWSMAHIGRALGRTRNEVAGKARRLGLQAPVAAGSTKSHQIRLMHARGVKLARIAREIGSSVAHARSIIWQDNNRERYRQQQRRSYARRASV